MVAITTVDLRAMSTQQISAFTTCALTATQIAALTAPQTLVYATPIVLDLNGDGIHTLAMDAGVTFDLLANGQAVQTGWVSPQDGLLVRDVNHDGTINDGGELFGSSTLLADGQRALDGYQALGALDSNQDGVINVADASFAELGVWVDSDSDGISETGEIRSLASLGITQLDLHTSAGAATDNGNLLGLTSTYQTADGATHDAADVWFRIQQAANALAPPDASVDSVMASRVSGLAQAIGSFDAAASQASALPSLPVMPAAASASGTLAVGDMVNAMRSFDLQAAALDSRSLGLQTAPITGLASVGMAPLSSAEAQQRIAALSPENLAAFTVPK
jgi:hypothetical protein